MKICVNIFFYDQKKHRVIAKSIHNRDSIYKGYAKLYLSPIQNQITTSRGQTYFTLPKSITKNSSTKQIFLVYC